MGNYRLPIWIASILGAVLTIFVLLLSIRQFQLLDGEPQVLRVSGIGSVESVQDIATVTLGVVAQGATVKEVKEDNSKKINQIIAFIKQVGIDNKAIKTTQFSIAPRYNYKDQDQTLVGYRATQTISIRVENVDKSTQQLESIIDGAVANGANQVHGVKFSFAHNDSLVQAARKQAIDKAKISAKEIAKEADLKIGPILNVITTDAGSPTPIFHHEMALSRTNSSKVELGQEEVFASVTVVFALR